MAALEPGVVHSAVVVAVVPVDVGGVDFLVLYNCSFEQTVGGQRMD